MSVLAENHPRVWTAADLVERFGPIPMDRIRTIPPPGTATEQDVIDIHDRENRVCELIDGTLVEKTMATYESYLAGVIFRRIGDYVEEHDLGIALPADGMMRLSPGLVRVPDVSFISWSRLPAREVPAGEIWDLSPDLAIEVLSPGNTRQEMEEKLADYFASGVVSVWYIYPSSKRARVFAAPSNFTELTEQDFLEAASLLPGFRLSLADLFRSWTGRGAR
jgi:Uma2 family endonuclease